MAEVTACRNNALPYPIYGFPWVAVFPILDNTGAFVSGAAGLDSEVSKNCDTPADCTNEATEIGSSGKYYLILTAAEMTADIVAVDVKTSTTDAKTTPLVFYPRKLVGISFGTAAGGAAGSITLDSGASDVDGFYNGMVCYATLDSAIEVRMIDAYVGSTKVASVTPDWNTTPDSDDTFGVFLPEGHQIQQANTTAIAGGSTAADNLRRSAEAIYYGTITGAADTTTLIDSALTQSGSDHWKGRIIIFLTGTLAKQATDITAFDPATDKLTYTAVTSSPSGGDTYVIV